MLLVDVSRSRLFGTVGSSRKDMIAEIAAVLSFSAILNNDKVGALFFSEKVEKFIPPKKGRSHLLHIIREIIEFEPTADGTDISEALRYLANALKKKCTAFLLSDMLDVDKSGAPPDVGLVHIKDSETGTCAWVNTSSKKMRDAYAAWFSNMEQTSSRLFAKHNIDKVSIALDEDYVKGLMDLFSKR